MSQIANRPCPRPRSLLSSRDRLVFLHVPKTAGTTLKHLLSNPFPAAEVCPTFANYPDLWEAEGLDLSRYRLIAGHYFYQICHRLPEPPLLMTMLRDPLERAVSYYHYVRRTDAHPHCDEARRLPLVEFLWRNRLDPQIANPMTFFLGCDVDFTDAVARRRHRQGCERRALGPEDLERARTRLENFSFVGLRERFQESLWLLAYTMALWPVSTFQSVNVAAQRPSTEEPNPDLVAAVAEVSRHDQALFHYGRTLFEDRLGHMRTELEARYSAVAAPGGEPVARLERHFEDMNQAVFKPRSATCLTFEAPLHGDGWHERELDSQLGPFRWTGPGATTMLVLPLEPEQELELRAEVHMTLEPEVLAGLELWINAERVPLDREEGPTGILLHGRVSPSAVPRGTRLSRLTLRVGRTCVASRLDPESRDHRPLGIALRSIELATRPGA